EDLAGPAHLRAPCRKVRGRWNRVEVQDGDRPAFGVIHGGGEVVQQEAVELHGVAQRVAAVDAGTAAAVRGFEVVVGQFGREGGGQPGFDLGGQLLHGEHVGAA